MELRLYSTKSPVSVCLSVCSHAYLRNHTPEIQRVFLVHVARVTVAWFSSGGIAKSRTSGFVDDGIFPIMGPVVLAS